MCLKRTTANGDRCIFRKAVLLSYSMGGRKTRALGFGGAEWECFKIVQDRMFLDRMDRIDRMGAYFEVLPRPE